MTALRICFPTGSRAGFVMEYQTYYIIAAVILAIVFLFLWQKEKKKTKRSDEPSRKTTPYAYHHDDSDTWDSVGRASPPKAPAKKPVTMTGAPTRAAVPPKAGRPVKVIPAARPAQRTLDAEYAERHNLWICPHCETMNAAASSRCAACGMIHGKRGDYYAM